MHHIIIQRVVEKIFVPKPALLRKWAKIALNGKAKSAELTLRIVGIDEMTGLNSTYRHKAGATNVLSFPFKAPQVMNMDRRILGDIVICADIVNHEAETQHKPLEAHWAHMVVHGVFHLLGYDHETEKEAEIMETLEIKVMNRLGFTNPYETGENINRYD